MKLTDDQIKQLHYHVNDKRIPYIEVRDEVLDHYQTALEHEDEKTMEDALEVLDQTFTIGYCKEIAKNYLQELKSEYPILLKRKVIQMFSLKRIPISFFNFNCRTFNFTIIPPAWDTRSFVECFYSFFDYY